MLAVKFSGVPKPDDHPIVNEPFSFNYASMFSARCENAHVMCVRVCVRVLALPLLFAMVRASPTHLPHRLTTKVSGAFHMVMHFAVCTVGLL